MSQQQTYLRLSFANGDVTEDVTPDLLGFTFTDNESLEADTVNLSLMDPRGKWADRWRPNNGETVRASIVPGTVKAPGRKSLFCGTFYVDTFRVAGAPRTCEIGAVSVPLSTPIRRKVKTRAWEKKDLKGIAGEIAKAAGLKLLFDSQENPTYDREDQKRESDLSFLMRLCENAGLSLKVTDKQLVIFDQASYEKKKPIKALTLGESEILSWDFSAAVSESYKSVTVSYRDPKKKSSAKEKWDKEWSGEKTEKNPALMSYTYTDPLADSSGQEYEHKARAKSLDDAKRIARAKLRALNRRVVTGSLTLVGDIELVAGVVVTLSGFGSFDGNFIITQATHEVGQGGYTTAISVCRVNSKY